MSCYVHRLYGPVALKRSNKILNLESCLIMCHMKLTLCYGLFNFIDTSRPYDAYMHQGIVSSLV